MRKKTFIIGCGRLGSSIALDAYARGDNVTVIDIDENSFDRLSDSFAGYTEVADATDAKSLEVLGIHDARGTRPYRRNRHQSHLPIPVKL